LKTRILALALCLSLLLTGCEAMLHGEYLTVEPHSMLSAAEDDSSVIRVENYQELVSGILSLVSACQEQGVIQLSNYNTRDVEADLTAACLEVSHEDPLGAYAVDYIKHEFSRILTYYQATITIGYRRTLEQLRSVVPVTGSRASRSEVQGALAQFQPEAVLRVTYFNEDEDYIRALALQAYYDTPAAAFGMPELSVAIYPDAGYQRIVEISFTYAEPVEALRLKSAQLQEAAREVAQPAVSRNFRGRLLLSALFGALLDHRAALEAAAPERAAPLSRPPGPTPPWWRAPRTARRLPGLPTAVRHSGGRMHRGPGHSGRTGPLLEHRHRGRKPPPCGRSLGRDGFYLTDQDYQALSGPSGAQRITPPAAKKIEFTP
jgi:hypothetical protein